MPCQPWGTYSQVTAAILPTSFLLSYTIQRRDLIPSSKAMPSWFGHQNKEPSPHKASGSEEQRPKATNPARQGGNNVGNEPPKARLGVYTLYEPEKPTDAVVELDMILQLKAPNTD